MTPVELLLQAESVTASRPGENGQLETILHETTLGVAQGELLAVVGPSGSGKSTLLRLFNRFLEPDTGQVLFLGKDIRTIDPPLLRSQIPLVAQKPFLFPGTVKDNLESSARLRKAELPDLRSPECQNLLRMCQVEPAWLDRGANKLSVGQQQRVCLLRAMLGPCKVLLLDEPTSALDPPTADQLAQTFRQLADEKRLTMILVTHDLRLAERCADRVALLQDGRVIEVGPTRQILHNPTTDAAKQFLSPGQAEVEVPA